MRRKYHFPENYNRDDTILVGIPRKFIPIIMGKLDELKYKSNWQTENDWEQAKQEVLYIQDSFIADIPNWLALIILLFLRR